MDDEKKEIEKPEDKKPEAAEAGDAEGSEPKTTTLIDDANLAAKRMEEANAERREILKQEQDLAARKALGGETEGAKPVEKKEESPKEYAEKVMSGELNKEK